MVIKFIFLGRTIDVRGYPSEFFNYTPENACAKFHAFIHSVTIISIRDWTSKTSSDLCPVTVVLNYLVVREAREGPLFIFRDGHFLMRQRLVQHVREVLESVGEDHSQYCSHSFRIGAATVAAGHGLEDSCSHQNSEKSGRRKYQGTTTPGYLGHEGYNSGDILSQIIYNLACGAWDIRVVCLVLGGGSAVPICLEVLLRGLHPFAPITPN